MGGDSNCVLSQSLDRLLEATSTLLIMSRILKNNCNEAGLVEVWRHKYPRVKGFTFYSIHNPHNSYSRIDFFFANKSEIHRIVRCDILCITLLDHAPVILTWDLGMDHSSKRWRFNNGMLNDNDFTKFVEVELQ